MEFKRDGLKIIPADEDAFQLMVEFGLSFLRGHSIVGYKHGSNGPEYTVATNDEVESTIRLLTNLGKLEAKSRAYMARQMVEWGSEPPLKNARDYNQ